MLLIGLIIELEEDVIIVKNKNKVGVLPYFLIKIFIADLHKHVIIRNIHPIIYDVCEYNDSIC